MSTQSDTSSTDSAGGETANVLIVDDSKVMRLALKKILKTDYNVFEASDGEEAWSILEQEPDIKIVFSDLSMPVLDGYGLLDRVRTSGNEEISELPFIVITGNEDDDGSREKALSSGATDFITKPFKSTEIKARAKSHIDNQIKIKEITLSFESKLPYDSVTNLVNEEHFMKRGKEIYSYSIRHQVDLSMLKLDLSLKGGLSEDREKSLLQEVADVIKEYTRNEDVISHYGHGQFKMLLPGISLDGADKLSMRLENFLLGFEPTKAGEREIEKAVFGSASIRTHSAPDMETLIAETENNIRTIEIAIEPGEPETVPEEVTMESMVMTAPVIPDEAPPAPATEAAATEEVLPVEEAEEVAEEEQHIELELPDDSDFDQLEHDVQLMLEEEESGQQEPGQDSIIESVHVQNVESITTTPAHDADKEKALEHARSLQAHIEERARKVEEDKIMLSKRAEERKERQEQSKARAAEMARKRSEIEEQILAEDDSRQNKEETDRIRNALSKIRQKEEEAKALEEKKPGFFAKLLASIKGIFSKADK